MTKKMTISKPLPDEILTPEQTCAKYRISFSEYTKLTREIYRTRVLDALYSFPDGVRRDILLYLVLSSR